MSQALAVAAGLACPVVMCGGMMLMGRRRKVDAASESSESLDDLREQHEQLGAKIARQEGDRVGLAGLD